MAANGEVLARQEEQNLEVIVREVLNHPSFHNTLRNNQSPTSSLGPSESPWAVRIALDFQFYWNCNSSQTPGQELQQLFFRGRANSLPQFQERNNWGP